MKKNSLDTEIRRMRAESASRRPLAAYFDDIPDLQLPQEMKDLAHVIIERKAGHFRPEEFNDRYEDAVVELIRAKQAGMPAKVTEQPARPSPASLSPQKFRFPDREMERPISGPKHGRTVGIRFADRDTPR